MKKIEQLLIKVIIIQFIFLFIAQLVFHQLNLFSELNQLTRYEGVNESTYTEILQTIQGNKK